MNEKYFNYIGGEWSASEGGEVFKVANPARPAQELGEFQLSTKEDARRAIEAAEGAYRSWRDTPAPQRGRILFKAAEVIEGNLDDFARTLTAEEGKPLSDSTGEVRRSIELLRFYGGQGSRINGKTYQSNFAKTFLYSIKQPLGTVALMTPWNFPIAIPTWKIAPALISGNCVVFKPASLTPMIATKLVSALERAGLPPGVLNMVTGPGTTVGEELTLNHSIAAISFTGSYEVGHGIQKARANAATMARIQLEMGGKNPTIVLPDAKLDDAVELVVKSAFGLTGQACTATSRAIVDESIKDRFVEKLAERARRFRVGDGLLQQDVEMGPAVSKGELEKDLGYIDLGTSEGARLVTGGMRAPQAETSGGYFIEPTVFDDVFEGMRIAKEEIFGPVLTVLSAKNADDAVEIANRSEYGLTACICTSNLASALEFADRIDAGVVKINRPTLGLELQVPFGGVKRSSSDTFREQGEEALDFYTRIKTVYMGY